MGDSVSIHMSSPQTPDDVDHGEDDDPDRVDEVPIQRQDIQPLGVLLSHLSDGARGSAPLTEPSRPTVT